MCKIGVKKSMDTYKRLSDLLEQVCLDEGVELNEIFDMPQKDNTNLILQFEKKFEVKLPEDYKFFLLKYGSGGMENFDYFGIELKKCNIDMCTVSLMTSEYRKKGMPNNLVVIEYDGDYITCIDTLKENKGQIVTWSWLDNGKIVEKADNFEEYFIEKLEDYV